MIMLAPNGAAREGPGQDGVPPNRSRVFFDESGYFGLSDGWEHDADGHAHRVCLFAGGTPVVVDPGRYTCGAEIRDGVDWRHWFESTAGHDTATVDGRDKTRQRFRAKHGPDAQAQDRELLFGDRSDWVRAKVRSHEYTPVHERFFLYMQREYVWIVDRIDPVDGHEHEAVVRYQMSDRVAGPLSLHEDVRGAELKGRSLLLTVHAGAAAQSCIESGWISTSCGTKRPAPVLAVSQRGQAPMFYCSVVAPARAGVTPRVVSTRRDGLVVTDLHGTGDAGSYHDTVLMAFARELPLCEFLGVRCRARDLAIRRDAQGVVTYVAASGAEYVEVDGAGLDVGSHGVVEWKREGSS